MRIKIILLLLCLQGSAFAQRAILLKDATIIDGDGSVKPYQGSVFIKDGIIKAVFKGESGKADAGAELIDCKGKFIVPGLIDAHVHLGTGNLDDWKKASLTRDSIAENLLRHGITTVRDMAGYAPFLAEYKTAVTSGKIPGPDIFYAAQFAGPSYFEMIARGSKDRKGQGTTAWYRAISNKKEVKQAIMEAKKAGVTGIKIYASLSRELIAEITREAHKQGLMAWAHGAIFPSKPIDVALAGVNSMSHANDLVFEQLKGDTIEIGRAWAQLYKGLKADTAILDRLLLAMKERNIYLDATVFHAENNKMVNAAIITRRANQLGVKIVSGTDWIYPTKNEDVALMQEVKLLASKCGMNSLEVIQCATLNGAQVTGLNDRGVIRSGKRADLLVLRQDPLNDVEHLFHPEIVFKRGIM
ncbi:amidohydrolase family protein [Pedobacter africanus]|uniref:Imidazolonepropionase n=1 Tax=Pedobacter africanus TaxID=151894 RepID=A0A1W2BAJ2_9SPHI|nr:amidohydrolase family protein [Pedobacter africanus]SMC69916.1 Imidazolonepropionase [Pedobacter africanus]